jgi:non-ribosomal peptide synthase protein (TIGR01720 family)
LDQQGNKRLAAYVIPGQRVISADAMELWPSVAEYYVYDEVLYYAMTHDQRRNASYKTAVHRLVKGKIVVEIGTGKDAILARYCAEAGAKRVYAIERDRHAYNQAKTCVRQLGLAGTIILIHGDATKVEVPEPADVSVSEILGPIGGCEGAAVIMNQTRRLLKPGAAVIPRRSITQIAAVTLPGEILNNPTFTKTTAYYTQKIFQQTGYPFDLRVCIKKFPLSHLVSNQQVFEDLDFTRVLETDYSRELSFTITRDARLDGFLVWLNLHTIEGEVIDILQHEHCWLPVYFPVFTPGIRVSAGDTIEAVCTGTLCENNLNPDYSLTGKVTRHKQGKQDKSVIEFRYDSFHHKQVFQSSPFYRQLFNRRGMNLLRGQESNPPANKEKPKQELVDQLKSHLEKHLPAYMIPSHFLLLEEYPLTPNGKIDRRALNALDIFTKEPSRDYSAPSTPVEKVLAETWARVLGVERVGRNDNFFKLGGDSILCIQAAARANQAGLGFTPKQLFTRQTIAQLAPVVTRKSREIKTDQGQVTGIAPLTPVQQWFFQQDFPVPHHFNQSVLLEVPPDIDPVLLKQVITRITAHHDALRLRFTRRQETWVQEHDDSLENAVFTVEDLSQYEREQQLQVLEESADNLQTGLDLTGGPLALVRLFIPGPGQPARLLLIIHHLVVDGVSWRILLEDVYRVYHQLARGKEPQLPPKTTSFKDWACKLTRYAASETLSREEDHWRKIAETSINPIPVDFPFTPGWNGNASYDHVTIVLNEVETTALLKDVPGAYRTHINDVLLTALALTFREWTGDNKLLLDLEGHGREDLFEDVNLSRTVGWFTAVFPILLEVETHDDPGVILKSVKEQLRRIPNRGIGYGVLRYLRYAGGSENQDRSFPVIQPRVLFNYLGQTDRVLAATPGWKLAKDPCGSPHSPDNSRTHQLEINGICENNQLEFTWTYSKRLYLPGTIENLAGQYRENLQELIRHCLAPEAGGFTPSDFPAVKVNQNQLDQLIANIK